MKSIMWFVYIIKSTTKKYTYIGSTNNINRRLTEHNNGIVASTKPYIPFKLKAYIAVETEGQARKLEKYFKTGSGKAVLNKRILSDEVH